MTKEPKPRIDAAQGCCPDGSREVRRPYFYRSFLGWQWLERPSLVVIGIGVVGLVLSWLGQTAVRVTFFQFPPPWACCVLALGGVALLAVSIAAEQARRVVVPDSTLPPKHWRTL